MKQNKQKISFDGKIVWLETRIGGVRSRQCLVNVEKNRAVFSVNDIMSFLNSTKISEAIDNLGEWNQTELFKTMETELTILSSKKNISREGINHER
jgi:hypothetical protein